MKKRLRKAFTLIEMMIVVAIIAILAGMAVPQYTKYVKKSESSEAVRIMKLIADAEVSFYSSHERYVQNTEPLLIDIPSSKFDYNLTVDNTNNCFRIRATVSGSTEPIDTIYLIYPSNTATNCINVSNIDNDFWDGNVYYGCYFNSCTTTSTTP